MGFAEHICGLSGLGFSCPACEVVRENREKGLSLSVQRDPLAISALLEDMAGQRDIAQQRYLDVVLALKSAWGDEVVRCDHEQLIKLITGDPLSDYIR